MPTHTKRDKQTIESLAMFNSDVQVYFEPTGVMGSLEQRATGEHEWKELHEQTFQKIAGYSLGNTRQSFFDTGSAPQTVHPGIREDDCPSTVCIDTVFPLGAASCLRNDLLGNSTSRNSNNATSQQERGVECIGVERMEVEPRIETVAKKQLDSAERSALAIDVRSESNFAGEKPEGAEEVMAAAVLTSLCLSPVLKDFMFDSKGDEDGLEDDAFDSEDTVPDKADMWWSKETNRGAKSRRQKNSSKTVFQCTWPRCGKIHSSYAAIIWHVRSSHLGPKDKDDNGFSDGEEEFYFNEIELANNDMNRHSSEGSVSPPLPQSRRIRSMSDPSRPTQPPVSSKITHAHMDDNFTRPLRSAGGSRCKPKRTSHQTLHTNSRKGRRDGRKCRKVYGMENRHLWCTQCRWKKACIKFVD